MTPPAEVTGLHIPADPDQHLATVPVVPTLAGLRAWVGDRQPTVYLEPLSITSQDHTAVMWLDEDGKAKGLPRNDRATMAARHLTGVATSDYVVGDVLVLGQAGEDVADLEAAAGVAIVRAIMNERSPL